MAVENGDKFQAFSTNAIGDDVRVLGTIGSRILEIAKTRCRKRRSERRQVELLEAGLKGSKVNAKALP
jgi:hypothetical protein